LNDEPEEAPKKEPWEIDVKSEGFDVFEYDAARARKSQRLVMAIFLLSLALYIFGMYSSYQNTMKEAAAREAREAQYRSKWKN